VVGDSEAAMEEAASVEVMEAEDSVEVMAGAAGGRNDDAAAVFISH